MWSGLVHEQRGGDNVNEARGFDSAAAVDIALARHFALLKVETESEKVGDLLQQIERLVSIQQEIARRPYEAIADALDSVDIQPGAAPTTVLRSVPRVTNGATEEGREGGDERPPPYVYFGDALVHEIIARLSATFVQRLFRQLEGVGTFDREVQAPMLLVIVDEHSSTILNLLSVNLQILGELSTQGRALSDALQAAKSAALSQPTPRRAEVDIRPPGSVMDFSLAEEASEVEDEEREAGVEDAGVAALSALLPRVTLAVHAVNTALKILPGLKPRTEISLQDANLSQEALHVAVARAVIQFGYPGVTVLDTLGFLPYRALEADGQSMIELVSSIEVIREQLANKDTSNADEGLKARITRYLALSEAIIGRLHSVELSNESTLLMQLARVEGVKRQIDECDGTTLLVEVKSHVHGATTVKESRWLWFSDRYNLEASATISARVSSLEGSVVYADLLAHQDVHRNLFGDAREFPPMNHSS
jgi:hypothetical protein